MIDKKLMAELKSFKGITNLAGKEFVTFQGLLYVAHKIGIEGIETECLSFDDTKYVDSEGNTIIPTYRCIFKAKVTMKNQQTFTGHGDASPRNVGKMIVPHLYRMAETRAVARALRFATGFGMTSSVELNNDTIFENK